MTIHPDSKTPVVRQMLRRGAVLAAVFGVGTLALLLARLYHIQITDHAFYEELAISQQLREAPGTARRGVIYDCNGNILAVSASVDNVYLSPAEIDANGEDRELIARELSRILDLDYNEILEKSNRRGSWYVTVARKIEADKAAEIRAFKTENKISGVRLETDSKRYYPNGRLACHLLGFVGTDNYGLEGIEARYDKALAGTAGKSLRATNAYGGEMLLHRYQEMKEVTGMIYDSAHNEWQWPDSARDGTRGPCPHCREAACRSGGDAFSRKGWRALHRERTGNSESPGEASGSLHERLQ